MNLLLPAFYLTLALDTLAFRLRNEQEFAAAVVVSLVATGLWMFALAAAWTRCEDLRLEQQNRVEAERAMRRARGQLRTLAVPLEAENDQRAPAARDERRAA